MSDAILTRARQFVSALPHSQKLRMEVLHAGDGLCEIRMPWDKALVGDPRTGVIFGGAVSALLDTCGGVAIMAHPAEVTNIATLDLRIDYMRSARSGQDIVARATCYHVTRNVAFVRATAVDDDPENPVATAAGAFSISRADGS